MLSGDIYEQAVVKTVAGFFHGISKHLFGVTRFRGAMQLRSGRPQRVDFVIGHSLFGVRCLMVSPL